MSYAPIASMSYTVEEGTYAVEVQESPDPDESVRDLRLKENPRVQTIERGDPIYGIHETSVRLRVHDRERYLTDKVLDGTDLKLKVSGPAQFEGPLNKVEDASRLFDSNPVVDILATGGIDALERPYDLTGTYTVAEWFWEMLPTDAGPDLLETTFDWTHSGQGSDHPGRSVRLPAGDVSFEDEDESELGVLKGMLRFWLCDLFQVGGAWRLRHRASTGDVLSYNGTGYQSGTSYSEASVGDSDFLRKVNSTRKEIKRISVAGLGGATSKRLVDPSGFQNTSFSDWNEDYSRPIGWELDGSVSHQTNGDIDLVRISSTIDSLLQSIERSYPRESTIHIELEYKIPSNASTGDYTMHLASCRLEGTADGSARYVKNDGSLTPSFSYLSKEVTITSSNQGSVQSATFNITIDPSDAEAGAPEIELTHAVPSGQTQTLEWVQYSTVEWTTTRAGPQAAVYEGAGDGQQSTSLATPLGDRTFWHARGGVIEIYDGSTWVPATEAWEQAGDTHAIHRARLYALLAERRREIHGLDAWYDRDRFALANALLYESDTHLPTQTDFRLGRGGQRLAGYSLHSDSVPNADINGWRVFEGDDP